MSESDSEAYLSGDESSSRVDNATKNCLGMRPEYNVSQKSKASTSKNFRAQIEKCRGGLNKDRSSSRLDSRKKMEDYFRDLVSDFSNLSKKLETVFDCLTGIFDRLDVVESRLDKLASAPPPSIPTYANVAGPQSSNIRLDKLEYVASEEERKRRSLDVTLTHPDIDGNSVNLDSHVRELLSTQLRMERREIDSSFRVKKLQRANSVLITFSDKRFKRFIFSAVKQLRLSNPVLCENLYLNENLTSYNFGILRSLKAERRDRAQNNRACFESVYSFEGKVYVKKCKTDAPSTAIIVSNKSVLQKIFSDLEQNASPSVSRSSPLPSH